MLNRIKSFICVVLLIACAFTMAAASSEKTMKGDFADIITVNSKTAFIKSYLMMDCCDEWADFCNLILRTENASSAEGLEFYEYNQKGRPIATKKNVTVLFHPTEEFAAKPYEEIAAYNLKSGKKYDAEVLENGDIKAVVKESGVFAFIKTVVPEEGAERTIWISNMQDCNGECRSCSDDW